MTGEVETGGEQQAVPPDRRSRRDVDSDETIIASRRDLAKRRAEMDMGAIRAGSTALHEASIPVSRQAARRFRAHEVRRTLVLTVLSVLLPGLGLVWTKRRNLGFFFLGAAALAAIILSIILLSGGLVQGAARLLTTKGLVLLLVLSIGGGLCWLASVLLTARETANLCWPEQTKWLHRGFTTLMCLIVASLAADATRYVLVTKNTFDTIFTRRYDGRGGTAATPAGGVNPWADVPWVNIMLVGSDAGQDRAGVRADSLIAASINTKTGDTTLISIPRNLGHVPFPTSNPLHKIYPDGFNCASGTCIMDAIWTEANGNHRDLFPKDEVNPGLDTTRDVVAEIAGLKIDYSTVVDLDGFQHLVDAMGGVWVNVQPDPGSPYNGIPIGGRIINGQVIPGSVTGLITPGYQKLNGYQALWYSRSRVGAVNGDDRRMQRQRCMLNFLVAQTNPVQMITKSTDLMNVAKRNITLDIPQDDLPAFATLAKTMKNGNLRSVDISNPVSNNNPDYAKIRAIVAKAIAQPHNKQAPTPRKSAAPSLSSSTLSSFSSLSSASPSFTANNPISDTADFC